MTKRAAGAAKQPPVREVHEESYAGLFENARDVLFTLDQNFNITLISPAFERILGLDRNEWVGRPFLDLVHPEDRPRFEEDLERGFKEPTVPDSRFRVRTKNGAFRVFETRLSPVVKDGHGHGLLGIARDMTERRRSEELRSLLASIVEFSDDAIHSMSLDGVILSWNRGAERLYGYTAEEAVGKAVLMLMSPSRLDEMDQMMARIRRGEVVHHYETERIRKDGRRINISLTVSPVRDASGRIVAVSSVARDITERLRRERERAGLLAVTQAATKTGGSEELGQAVVHALTEALKYDAVLFYLALPEERRLRIIAQTGLSSEAYQTVHSYPLEPSAPFVAVQTYYSQRTQVIEDLQARSDLGHVADYIRERSLETLMSVPILGGDKCLGVLQAVTSERPQRLPEELKILQVVADTLALAIQQKELVNRLARAVHELDAFVYTVSHDLGEPLRTITNFSRLALEEHGPEVPPEVRDYLERIYRGARRMRTMLDALLKYSRLESMPESEAEVDVGALLDEVRESLAATLQERNARVLLEGRMPVLRTQRTRLAEILTNLVSNGIKFNQSPVPVVRVGCRDREGFYEFWVEDNGIGIPESYRDKLFKLFTRLHGQEAYPGTGAGLAIVARCVEQLGGRIWVDSVVGAGSRFWFTIPLHPPSQRQESYVATKPTPENPPH